MQKSRGNTSQGSLDESPAAAPSTSGKDIASRSVPVTWTFLDAAIKQLDAMKDFFDYELLSQWESLGEDGKKLVNKLYWIKNPLLDNEITSNIKNHLLKNHFITADFTQDGDQQYDEYRLSDRVRKTLNELIVLMHLGIFGIDWSENPQNKVASRRKLELQHSVLKKKYALNKNMAMDKATIVFKTKEEFQRYFNAYDDGDKYFKSRKELREKENKLSAKSEDKKKIEEVIDNTITEVHSTFSNLDDEEIDRYMEMRPWLRVFTRAYCYVEILDDAREYLKKRKKFDLLLKTLDLLIKQVAFRQHKINEWYADKVFILQKEKQYPQAAEILLEAFKQTTLEEQRDILRPRAKVLFQSRYVKSCIKKQLKAFVDSDLLYEYNFHDDEDTIYAEKLVIPENKSTDDVAKTNQEVTVEKYCMHHYLRNNFFSHGINCEGKLVRDAYLLLFWDIIYTKPEGVVGVFMSYYQEYPLDMFSEHFYINRKVLIEERLSFIEKSDTEAVVVKMANNKDALKAQNKYMVEWKYIIQVVQCLGGRALAAICRRLTLNFANWLGFPDLILWNNNASDPKEKIKILEVKRKDSTKPRQLRWLQYLTKNGINAGLCYVLTPPADVKNVMQTLAEDVKNKFTIQEPPDNIVGDEESSTKGSMADKIIHKTYGDKFDSDSREYNYEYASLANDTICGDNNNSDTDNCNSHSNSDDNSDSSCNDSNTSSDSNEIEDDSDDIFDN